MTIGADLHESLAQPDFARLTYGGVTYSCTTWLDRDTNSIVADIAVDQEDGQSVGVDRSFVWTDPKFNQQFADSPKVIGLSGTGTFVVHWFTGTGDGEDPSLLHRSTFAVSDIASGWNYRGTITTHESCLHDISNIDGNDTDFVFVHRTDESQWSSYRVTSPYAWFDNVWGPQNNAYPIATRVMSIAADTNDCLVSWQTISKKLWVFRVDTADGANSAVSEVFGDLIIDSNNGLSDFTQCGIVKANGGQWLVCAELLPGSYIAGLYPFNGLNEYCRIVAWRLVNGSTSVPVYNSHYVHHVSMLSRPWTWASGQALANNAYVLVGHSIPTAGPGQFGTQPAFVINLALGDIADASLVGEVKPRVESALMSGAVDTRPTGRAMDGQAAQGLRTNIGRRLNHISHVCGPPHHPNGPDLKSVTMAHMAWSKLVPVTYEDSELEPSMARVRTLTHYHEEPWVLRRDPKEPTATDENYKGSAHRCSGPCDEVAGSLVRPGGTLTVFDGHQQVEQGFFWAPEIVAIADNGGGSGAMEENGVYWYTANFVWTDRTGQLHRGPLATPRFVQVLSDKGTVKLSVLPMTLSMKDHPAYPSSKPVFIEFWRTSVAAISGEEAAAQVDGIFVFRRLYGQASSSPSVDSFRIRDTPVSIRSAPVVTIVDALGDDLLVKSEPCPFQLNTSQLQWSPPPPTPHVPLRVLCQWQNRLWGVNPEDDRVIVYSDEILPLGTQYVAPEFFDSNTYRFDGRGEITALYPMDNRLFVFTRDGVYALVGDGNDGSGTGATLRLEVVADAIGCIEPRSVCLIPAVGIFFQAAKGAYLFTRETGMEYIGAPVEDIIRAGGNIRSAVLLEGSHQIRITLDGPPSGTTITPRVLIFDYLQRQWSGFDAPPVGHATSTRLNVQQSATTWRGSSGETLHVMLQSGGLAVGRQQDDPVAFADTTHTSSTPVIASVTTSWISLAGIGGLKRVKEIGIHTDRLANGEMTVEFWADRDGTYDDSIAPEVFHFSNPAPAYMVIRPRTQKFTSFKLRITESEIPNADTVRFKGVTAYVAQKRGLRRVSSSQRGVPQ